MQQTGLSVLLASIIQEFFRIHNSFFEENILNIFAQNLNIFSKFCVK